MCACRIAVLAHSIMDDINDLSKIAFPTINDCYTCDRARELHDTRIVLAIYWVLWGVSATLSGALPVEVMNTIVSYATCVNQTNAIGERIGMWREWFLHGPEPAYISFEQLSCMDTPMSHVQRMCEQTYNERGELHGHLLTWCARGEPRTTAQYVNGRQQGVTIITSSGGFAKMVSMHGREFGHPGLPLSVLPCTVQTQLSLAPTDRTISQMRYMSDERISAVDWVDRRKHWSDVDSRFVHRQYKVYEEYEATPGTIRSLECCVLADTTRLRCIVATWDLRGRLTTLECVPYDRCHTRFDHKCEVKRSWGTHGFHQDVMTIDVTSLRGNRIAWITITRKWTHSIDGPPPRVKMELIRDHETTESAQDMQVVFDYNQGEDPFATIHKFKSKGLPMDVASVVMRRLTLLANMCPYPLCLSCARNMLYDTETPLPTLLGEYLSPEHRDRRLQELLTLCWPTVYFDDPVSTLPHKRKHGLVYGDGSGSGGVKRLCAADIVTDVT